MLVLSRKTGQSIEIGDEVTVNVTDVKGNRVRLSIQAPQHVSILRSELTSENDILEQQHYVIESPIDRYVSIR